MNTEQQQFLNDIIGWLSKHGIVLDAESLNSLLKYLESKYPELLMRE